MVKSVTNNAKIECVEKCIKELEPHGLVDSVNVLKKRLKELKQPHGSVQKGTTTWFVHR